MFLAPNLAGSATPAKVWHARDKVRGAASFPGSSSACKLGTCLGTWDVSDALETFLTMDQVDLLHPLTSLEWSEYREIPVGVYINAQAVVMGNKVYIGGGIMHPGSSSRLLVYDYTKDSWDILDTPTQWYALTTYHSQVVLVGGMDPDTGRATNQLWVLNEQCHWTQPLPPMTIERYQASAVSLGDYLIVAGGCGGTDDGHLDVVEVYDGHQWMRAQSLPRACSCMKTALHEGNWYLAGGMGQGSEVYHTSLGYLIAATHSEGTRKTIMWKQLPGTALIWSTPAALRNQLIIVGGGYHTSSSIHTYSASTKSWVHVGDMPIACYSTNSTLVLPTGELLVVGDTKSGPSSHSFRASIKVTSFPDGHFDMSALGRLEVAGIPIFNKLAPKFLSMALGLYFPWPIFDNLRKENNPVEGSRAMMKAWISGKSSLPPTWQVLLEKLQFIDMRELAQEIEHFFNRKPPASPVPISENKKEEFELDISAIENKEQQTKPDFKDVAVQNKPDCQEVAVQTHSEATATGLIRGVEVIRETVFIVPNQGGSFDWKGYGLRLHVPKDSLPPSVEACRLNIKASFSGQFQLPEDSDLLSPVFWISSSCQFTQPVTLEIQHCALREDVTDLSSLTFVSAKCSQKDLPYRFRQVEGGLFTTHSSYGSIQLSHFSGNAVIGRKRTPRSYCAHLYHTMKQMYEWRFYFVITQDLEAKNTVVRKHYGHFAKKEATLRISFGRSEITLGIPDDGLVTKEGWRITPFSFPTISKKDADQFEPGQWIPECQLIVQWKKEDQRPVQLMHKVDLIGAKPPSNFFHLTLNPKTAEDMEVLHSPPRMQLSSHSDFEGFLPIDSVRGIIRHPSTSSFGSGGGSGEYSQATAHTPDMKDLLEALYHTVADKWEPIGIYLHLPMATLKGIAEERQHDPHKCLIGVLEMWLKRVDPPPTWSALIEAVKFLGEEQLGRELREKYCL